MTVGVAHFVTKKEVFLYPYVCICLFGGDGNYDLPTAIVGVKLTLNN